MQEELLGNEFSDSIGEKTSGNVVMRNSDEKLSNNAESMSEVDNSLKNEAEITSDNTNIVSKMFNKNFILLWQGQFVSSFGDVVYELALGFWVLVMTGSTALMGTLAAASMLPRIVVSPFAGVVADRVNRKWLMILMDAIRGVVITTVGLVAVFGHLQIWMVFVAGVVLGLCGAFFTPTATSVIPDIVPKESIMSANSIFGMIPMGTNILGSSLGGILYTTIGAPLLFLFNGISYLISGIFQLPVTIPKIVRHEEKHFLTDLKDGYKFMWGYKGLRDILIISSVMNFFVSIAIVLFLPFFQRYPNLGADKYGIGMACFTGGMLIGMIITSIIKFKPSNRFGIFIIGQFLASVCFAFSVMVNNYIFTFSLMLLGGVMLAVTGVFINTVIQLTVPADMRGKVFSLIGMSTQAFMPVGMLVGGILGEFIPIHLIIFTCFMIVAVSTLPFIFSKSFKEFMNYDPDASETVALND